MKKNKLKYLIYIILCTAMILIFFQFEFLREITKVIFISFIISYALTPLHNFLVNRGLSKKMSAVLILMLFLILMILFLVILIPSIINESANFKKTIENMDTYIKDTYKRFEVLRNNTVINNFFNSTYQKANVGITKVLENLFNSILSIGESVLTYVVVPIIIYYFLADKDNISNRILITFSCKNRTIVKRIIGDINKILSRYIISQFILCFFIGILTFIVLKFLNIQYPVMLSIFNGVLNIIPYFGPFIGNTPVILVALMTSPKLALYAAFWLLMIQQLEGNVICPKVIGETVSIHPLIVILLLVIGGEIGGLLGMVLAIPCGVILKIIYEDINYYLF